MATLGLLCALAGALLSVTQLGDRFDARRRAEPPERVLYLPKGDSLKFMCLGYDGLAADMTWLRGVMYVGRRLESHGRDRGHERKYQWMEKLYQVTTDLDPHWSQPYRVGAILLAALPQDDERAMNLLRRGVERNPGDWEIALEAAKLDMLRGRNRDALKWLNVISRTMPGHNKTVEATATRLHIEHHDYRNAVKVAVQGLEVASDPLMRTVHGSNYREALARLIAADLSEWSRLYRASGARPPADARALLEVRFGQTDGSGRAASVRERLFLRLAELTGPDIARELARGLPADPFGMEFYLRPDGQVASRGLERMELFRLVASLNPQMASLERQRGRPVQSLDELMEYFLGLYRTNQLSPGLASLLGRPPRLPAHPSGDQAAWKAVPLVDGRLQMPPGPTVDEMRSAPLIMPPGPASRAGGH